MHAKIYHNPACGTSRNTLALLRHAGIEPVVIDYLESPPSADELRHLIEAAGLSVREAIREKGTPFATLGLDDESLPDAALIEAMVRHPILINRPFVVTPLGTRLCRPSEAVLDILPADCFSSAFVKEDGEPVLGEDGQRLA